MPRFRTNSASGSTSTRRSRCSLGSTSRQCRSTASSPRPSRASMASRCSWRARSARGESRPAHQSKRPLSTSINQHADRSLHSALARAGQGAAREHVLQWRRDQLGSEAARQREAIFYCKWNYLLFKKFIASTNFTLLILEELKGQYLLWVYLFSYKNV